MLAATKLPTEFFVFITTDDLMVRWNVEILRSIDSAAVAAYASPEFRLRYDAGEDVWLPFVPNPNPPNFLGSQSHRAATNYRAEYNAECVRMRQFRQAPSRLSAIFAWGSLDEAREALARNRGRYKSRPLKRCVLAAPPLRAIRVNSEVVPIARRMEAMNASTAELIHDVWGTYWSSSSRQVGFNAITGFDPLKRKDILTRAEPLWEWLLDGSLRIVGDVSP
jgi:hypothetical protein